MDDIRNYTRVKYILRFVYLSFVENKNMNKMNLRTYIYNGFFNQLNQLSNQECVKYPSYLFILKTDNFIFVISR